MKRFFITCIMKNGKLLILMAAIMLCAVGTNCLAGASTKQNLISGKKVLQMQIPNTSGAMEDPYYVYSNSVGSLDIDFKLMVPKLLI